MATTTRTERSAPADSRTRVLRVILLATFLSSIGHYTDNFLRFDQYPPGDDGFVTQSLVLQSWILFTAFGVLGYVLYLWGRWAPAAACFVVYATSGLISPLHYTEGSLSEFDLFQHTFILTDLLAGAALVGFAGWLLLRERRELTG